MEKERKVKQDYSAEYKLKLVRAVVESGRDIKDVYKEHNLHRQTLHRWVNEYRQYGESAFNDEKAVITTQALLKQKDRRIKELEEENEILKKFQAYLAKQKK
jgi:transposase